MHVMQQVRFKMGGLGREGGLPGTLFVFFVEKVTKAIFGFFYRRSSVQHGAQTPPRQRCVQRCLAASSLYHSCPIWLVSARCPACISECARMLLSMGNCSVNRAIKCEKQKGASMFLSLWWGR